MSGHTLTLLLSDWLQISPARLSIHYTPFMVIRLALSAARGNWHRAERGASPDLHLMETAYGN